MRTSEIIAAYEAAIADLSREMARAAEERIFLEDFERKITILEAGLVAAGVEGKNESERKANLTLGLEASAEYRGLCEAVVQVRQRIANADMQVTVAREHCRLYRLQLALAASPAVLEAVA